ncbi:MAG: aspartate aminotransferase family protein [Clostridiales bacterium]|nr:aspartate aminotransferase family protein [Clostridiales bacterium]
MDFEALKALDDTYVAHTYARFDVGLVRGQGATAWDDAGADYIDFTSGIGVNALGFADRAWAEAVFHQLTTLQHTSNLYYTEPCAQLAQSLAERTGLKKAFFANSGAEANECAIKCARKYSRDRYGAGRATIVTLVNSFHGRTLTALSATGQAHFHQHFFPFTEGFAFAPSDDIDAARAVITPDVCAVMIELVQGEGGVMPLDRGYVRAMAQLCAERDLLLIVDEVQTGMGRTGTLFAFQQYGLLPDVVTCAKGLGGGLPIGAALMGERAMNVLGPGDHASTFGGNPAVCAGAQAVLDRLNENLLAEVAKKGDYIGRRLREMPHVTAVDGMGLMLGATLQGVEAADVVKAGLRRGVMTLTAKKKLRLLPPLTIATAELELGLTRLEAALKGV